ncbi:hypothetical protein [Actinomadura sp. 7K507]|uniref:hypothetical protein n=1 Tax=Actinomadura sp. 7K507 TaxID=2530365 RepID=UPI00104C9FCF|nr:hypothetical protein [Actinomadura sp. 7K507]TDC97069.1 hypothetical protein E1285_04735 [Actinomadura sp. 7K507]
MRDEPVAMLLLQHLFPQWSITRDERGLWRATVSASSVDGLLDVLAAADPQGARRAACLLKERRSAGRDPG